MAAAELRARLALREDQLLTLLLFDADPLLERLWSGRVLLGIVEAGYDVVVSPSFSAWSPRPRTETMLNAKRSMSYFGALQEAGVTAVPRVVWEVERDVERYATWITDNASVQVVAVDLQTYRSTQDWAHQLRGLAYFDRLTGKRLTYLVNGPTTVLRCASLFCVAQGRISITNATSQLGLRGSRRNDSLLGIEHLGERFEQQIALAEARITEAQWKVRGAAAA